MWTLKGSNFPKLNSAIWSNLKVKRWARHINSKVKGAKEEIYTILVVEFRKWINILGHPKKEKVDKQIGIERVYDSVIFVPVG